MKLELLALPRVAFSRREVARPGEVWRVFQQIAIDGSARRGWPPARYAREGCAFVMRSMRVVHDREIRYGAQLEGKTSCVRIRRDMFFTRRSAILDDEGTVARTYQEWAVVSAAIEPMRANSGLVEAFAPADADVLPEVVLPTVHTPLERELAPLEHDALFCETDPLDHVNHTVYVDWCDGAIARALVQAGLSPADLVPRAEEATFRAAVAPGDRAHVATWLRGCTPDGALVFDHEVRVRERVAASLRTVRSLWGDEGGRRMSAALAP